MEEEGDEDTAGTDGDDESEEEKAGSAATPGLVLIKEPPKRDPRCRPRESAQIRL